MNGFAVDVIDFAMETVGAKVGILEGDMVGGKVAVESSSKERI